MCVVRVRCLCVVVCVCACVRAHLSVFVLCVWCVLRCVRVRAVLCCAVRVCDVLGMGTDYHAYPLMFHITLVSHQHLHDVRTQCLLAMYGREVKASGRRTKLGSTKAPIAGRVQNPSRTPSNSPGCFGLSTRLNLFNFIIIHPLGQIIIRERFCHVVHTKDSLT